MSELLTPARRAQAILSAHSQDTYWHNERLYVLDHSVRAQGTRLHYLTETVDATDWTIVDVREFLNY